MQTVYAKQRAGILNKPRFARKKFEEKLEKEKKQTRLNQKLVFSCQKNSKTMKQKTT